MRKKSLTTILLTAVLFLSACFLTVTSIYRVSAITLEISVISEEAKQETEELEKAIAKRYKKESIFSVGRKQAEEEFEKYPHLRITRFQKSYPNRLIIKGAEDSEVYALESENGYYILGGDGTVLCERNTLKNRSDGQDNLLLDGLHLTPQKGQIPMDNEFSIVLDFCKELDVSLGGIRANITSVVLEKPTSRPEDAVLVLTAREGVKMVVYNPSVNTELKAENLSAYYETMETVDRLSGTVYVSDDGKCSYEA